MFTCLTTCVMNHDYLLLVDFVRDFILKCGVDIPIPNELYQHLHLIDYRLSKHSHYEKSDTLIYVGGAFCSGKTYWIKDNFRGKAYVNPNPDWFRKEIKNQTNLHQCCIYLSLMTEFVALYHQYPVIIDVSMRTSDFFKKAFPLFREMFSHLKYIRVVKIDTSLDIILERNRLRTHRLMDEDFVIDCYHKCQTSIDELIDFVDIYDIYKQ